MTTPNPFDPYRRLGCYGPPGDVDNYRPWWCRAGFTLVKRTDGLAVQRDGASEARLRDIDTQDPLPRPPALPGQVWAVNQGPCPGDPADPRGQWVQWVLFHMNSAYIHADGTVRAGAVKAGAVLVYGPGAPWAPPEWAPGKVWNGKEWTDG